MPYLSDSDYKAPFGFKSAKWQTIYAATLRRLPAPPYERERIETPDGDFLDLDWARKRPSKKLAILSHGLEGSSKSKYVQGMIHTLDKAGWNVLAWNFRGCSGEPNSHLHSYHCGSTEDLAHVFKYVDQRTHYETIALIGFSLGGNVTLKWLGDLGSEISPKIRAGIGVSVGCDLAGTARRLETKDNRIYMRRFLKSLRAKIREKAQKFPGKLCIDGLDQITTFHAFDQKYTAPIHGFYSAEDYWEQSSCLHKLNKISVPTLLINSRDDPFLTPSCSPLEFAKRSSRFHLEMPEHGGHMAFIQFNDSGTYWAESRCAAFLSRWI